MSNDKKIVVIYHMPCQDGFSSAWVLWTKFKDRASYIPYIHGNSPVADFTGKTIYFCDVVYPMPILKKLMKKNRVIVLDHHISRKAETESAHEHRYGTDHSGVGLAWEYFYPKKPIPHLLKLIEEEDLWKFKTKNGKQITAPLKLVPFEFEAWGKFVRAVQNPKTRRKIMDQGKVILQYREALIRIAVDNANLVEFEGIKAYAVSSVLFNSEICNALIKRLPPIGITWTARAGRLGVSLRSDGTVDVSKLAAKYGGGGHRQASAFNLPLTAKLPWKYIKK